MRLESQKRFCVALLAMVLATVWGTVCLAETSLHERIDQVLDSAAVGPVTATCSDADYLRRVSLDLAGVVPTAGEAKAFLEDSASDKRLRLVERLLASPEYARHMALVFDALLMERMPEKAVKTPEWQEFLRKSFAENKPLDQLARDLLVADGVDPARRPAARFLLDRNCEPNMVTRDVGRLMFGLDLQCAQCHDHPLIDEYFQADYYGLYAFLQRTELVTETKSKLAVVAEKADGEASYKSVFTGDSGDRVTPRLPKGASLLAEPVLLKGKEYEVAPAKGVRHVPKYSRRQALAGLVADSQEFRRNWANRIWAHLFGQGLVHPVDFHHAANPPSHPRLLALLAEELKATGFDLKAMLRELTLTRAYQRAIDAPKPSDVDFATIPERSRAIEAERDSQNATVEVAKATYEKARLERQEAVDGNKPLAAEIAALQAAASAAQVAADKKSAELSAAKADQEKKQQQSKAVAEAAAKAKEAVAAVPGDKVLAQSAAKIAERAKALQELADAAGKIIKDRESAADKAKEDAAAAQAALTKKSAEAVPAEQLAKLEAAELNARHALADERFVLKELEGRLAILKSLAEYEQLAKTDATAAVRAWDALLEQWTTRCQVGRLRPLSSEQFVLSILQATGELTQQRASAQKDLNKKPPEALKKAAESEKAAITAALVEGKSFEQLRGAVNNFVALYGGLPGQDFQATVNQALFFGNGSAVDKWLKPSEGNLTDRLGKTDDAAALADDLYLSILTRFPTADEKKAVADFLEDRKTDRPTALQELAWALISSNEFRFNH